MVYPGRLAHQGEQLITRRFPDGSIGLADPGEIHLKPNGFWDRLLKLISRDYCPDYEIILMPGYQARLEGIEIGLGKMILNLPPTIGIFEYRRTEAPEFRNGFELDHGQWIALQMLKPGVKVTVISRGEESGVLEAAGCL